MEEQRHRIVIIGGGFGGLAAAIGLKKANADITLIDRKNYHLFQPLLYQVATGSLSAGDIASPLRAVLYKQKNTRVLLAEVVDFDTDKKRVILEDGVVPYDTLIVSAGSSHHYFGHDEWETIAPGLKTVEDATDIRKRIFYAFETAERETDPERIQALLTFIIIGGGPTGVELAGAVAEIARDTLKNEFRRIDPSKARIFLVEGLDRILNTYDDSLSQKARESLEKLGVTVITGSMVTDINDCEITLGKGDNKETILCETVLWAAGVKSSPLGNKLAKRLLLETDKAGRIRVNEYLKIENYDDIFVIGDMAIALDKNGEPLPGIAAVARQQGAYLAKLISARIKNKQYRPFRYRNYGIMATIGRSAAVADFHWIKLSGWLGWVSWLFIHLMYIVEFENRVLVLVQWAWNYFTRARSNRLILGRRIAKNIKSGLPEKQPHHSESVRDEIFR